MKMVVFSGSSFSRRGITSMLLSKFTAGAREAGASIENLYVNKLNVNPCRGDLSCWFKNRGVCIQSDDMNTIIPKVQEADCIVFSTPVFCDGIPGKLKCVMDRFVVLGNPLFEVRDNHTRHPLPEEPKKKFVLIASCGLWELDNFDPMIVHLKAFCRNVGYDYAGALLRPHSFMMKTGDVNDILVTMKNAGKELVANQIIPEDLQCIVCREIISREEYIALINKKVHLLSPDTIS